MVDYRYTQPVYGGYDYGTSYETAQYSPTSYASASAYPTTYSSAAPRVSYGGASGYSYGAAAPPTYSVAPSYSRAQYADPYSSYDYGVDAYYPEEMYAEPVHHQSYHQPSTLNASALRRLDATHGGVERPRGDRASQASRRSSVGSQWAGITADGPYNRLQRQHGQSISLKAGWVPRPTGRRLAMCIGIDPPRSLAATNSIRHMCNFLRRSNFTVESIIFDGNEDQFENDIYEGINQLMEQTEEGDSVFFHVIGYGAFRGQEIGQHVGRLVQGLQPGVKLHVVLDSCFAEAVRGAFDINHEQPAPRKAGQQRIATRAGKPVPVGALVFMFQGNSNKQDIARFDTKDGQACTFTASVILAFNAKDAQGGANAPSYAQLDKMIARNCTNITSKIPRQYAYNMICTASCSDLFDIDQPAFL